MNLIRQYLKQKVAKSFGGKYDLDVIKKEIRDEVTHILLDQTHRTPIVIPVINEIGGSRSSGGDRPNNQHATSDHSRSNDQYATPKLPHRKFPPRQVPDTEANDTKAREKCVIHEPTK